MKQKKRIEVDFEKLKTLLGVPVVSAAARAGEGLSDLKRTVKDAVEGEKKKRCSRSVRVFHRNGN